MPEASDYRREEIALDRFGAAPIPISIIRDSTSSSQSMRRITKW